MKESPPRYDGIGHGYVSMRQEDPRLLARIVAAPGSARTVVNVGAGAGSYEPRDRHVVAIEPSDVMAAQRPRHLAPALKGGAHRLPLRDGSVDAAMSRSAAPCGSWPITCPKWPSWIAETRATGVSARSMPMARG